MVLSAPLAHGFRNVPYDNWAIDQYLDALPPTLLQQNIDSQGII